MRSRLSLPVAAALAALLTMLAVDPAVAGPRRGAAAVTDVTALALVTELDGRAALTSAEDPAPVPVRRFDWLPEGSTLTVGAGSRAVVVMFSGERLVLVDGASGRITQRGLLDPQGEVSRLAPLPPLPRVRLPESPSGRAAAVRVHGEGLQLYPSDGARTLARDTVLRFGSDARLVSYEVTLLGGKRGKPLVERTTAEPEFRLPADLLAPGSAYRYEVRARDAMGLVVFAAAEFTTLSRDEELLRQGLRDLMPERDASTLRYLAEVDRDLGLLWEWLDGSRAALELSQVCPDAAVILPHRKLRPCRLPELPPAPGQSGR